MGEPLQRDDRAGNMIVGADIDIDVKRAALSVLDAVSRFGSVVRAQGALEMVLMALHPAPDTRATIERQVRRARAAVASLALAHPSRRVALAALSRELARVEPSDPPGSKRRVGEAAMRAGVVTEVAGVLAALDAADPFGVGL